MAIAITIKPQHVCNIMNGIKKGEVRKNKALLNAIKKEIAEKGKATIYCICSKSGKGLTKSINGYRLTDIKIARYYNGKVVCKFECEKVEGIDKVETCYLNGKSYTNYETEYMGERALCDYTCLRWSELYDYFYNAKKRYLIHISNLKVFDKAKELKELYKVGFKEMLNVYKEGSLGDEKTWLKVKDGYSIKKAPQNFCYVED